VGLQFDESGKRKNMNPGTFFLILTLLLVLAALIIPALQDRSKRKES